MAQNITASEIKRIKKNSFHITSIINHLEGFFFDPSDEAFTGSMQFLLTKDVREYRPAPSNYRVSIAAEALWNSITSADITSFYSLESFRADKISQPTSCNTCKGPHKSVTSYTLVPGKKFKFSDIFIEEHTVPVTDTTDALKAVYLEYKDSADLRQHITDIMEKMCCARILRTENVLIQRSDRISPEDLINKSSEECFNQIYNQHYIPFGIILK